MNTVAAVLGYIFATAALAAWFSPYLCRIIAAACLTHADSLDDYRERRRFHWERHSGALGISTMNKATSNSGT